MCEGIKAESGGIETVEIGKAELRCKNWSASDLTDLLALVTVTSEVLKPDIECVHQDETDFTIQAKDGRFWEVTVEEYDMSEPNSAAPAAVES
jgi:hypothetical protein